MLSEPGMRRSTQEILKLQPVLILAQPCRWLHDPVDRRQLFPHSEATLFSASIVAEKWLLVEKNKAAAKGTPLHHTMERHFFLASCL